MESPPVGGALGPLAYHARPPALRRTRAYRSPLCRPSLHASLPTKRGIGPRPSARARPPAQRPSSEHGVGRRRFRLVVRDGRLSSAPRALHDRARLLLDRDQRRGHRTERQRGAARVGRSLRVPPGGGGRARRRFAVPGSRRPDPRGSEGLRLSAAAPAGARPAHAASERRRRGDRGGGPARASRAHALDPGHSRRSLLRRRASLGAGVERCAAREHLDPARVCRRGRVEVPGRRCGSRHGRSGSRSRRSS